MGTHDFKYNNVPFFARKPGNINALRSAAPKLALVSASRYYCDVIWSNHNVCAKVSLRLKEVQMGNHDIKYNKLPFFLLEKQGISILRCLLP